MEYLFGLYDSWWIGFISLALRSVVICFDLLFSSFDLFVDQSFFLETNYFDLLTFDVFFFLTFNIPILQI